MESGSLSWIFLERKPDGRATERKHRPRETQRPSSALSFENAAEINGDRPRGGLIVIAIRSPVMRKALLKEILQFLVGLAETVAISDRAV
jgi:hypothetical protein